MQQQQSPTIARPPRGRRRHPALTFAATAAAALLAAGCGDPDICCPRPDPDPENGNVIAVSVGAQHSCALRDDGRAFCWGRNDHGQLGDGGALDCWGANEDGQLGIGAVGGSYPTPQAVVGGRTYGAASAGDLHSCAV